MITTQQKEALSVLAEICALSPDVRLGQLFAHLGFLGEAHVDHGLGYIEDDELLSVMYKHLAELQSRMPRDESKAFDGGGLNLLSDVRSI